MTLITKPEFTYVWASGGAVVAPNDSKKQLGWVAEAPPFQYDNWLQNRQDQMLAHINQRGIPAWDALTNYEAGSLSYVQGSDGKIYKSVAASGPSATVQNPTTDGTDTYWTIAFADVGAFLTQATGDARYAQRSNNLSDLTNVAAARTNLALGTAATATLTTSNTDGTVGRVLKVGDFGLGAVGATPALANIDSHYLATGLYWFTNGAGTPPAVYGYVLVQRADASTSMQTFTTTDATKQWVRYSNGSVWSPWKEIALTDSPAFTGTPTAPTPSIGTRSTAIATMQNFANEFGSSLAASGYQKLPTGLIIQWGRGSFVKGSLYSFPMAFPSATLAMVASHNGGTNSLANPVVTFNGLTQYSLNWSATDNPVSVNWIAIGC